MQTFLIEKLCRNFCAYYKPSKDAELACMGLIVIDRLIKKGRKISFKKSDTPIGAMTQKTLAGNICKVCSFYDGGCDFAGQKENALPCGGFMLLGQSIESGIISINDIRNND